MQKKANEKANVRLKKLQPFLQPLSPKVATLTLRFTKVLTEFKAEKC